MFWCDVFDVMFWAVCAQTVYMACNMRCSFFYFMEKTILTLATGINDTSYACWLNDPYK